MNSEILYSIYKEAMNTDGFIITAYYVINLSEQGGNNYESIQEAY